MRYDYEGSTPWVGVQSTCTYSMTFMAQGWPAVAYTIAAIVYLEAQRTAYALCGDTMAPNWYVNSSHMTSTNSGNRQAK